MCCSLTPITPTRRHGEVLEAATDQLRFFLSNNAYYTLSDDNHWSLDQTESWLAQTIRTLLLRWSRAVRHRRPQEKQQRRAPNR